MLAILQFDEESRGMVAHGEATYDNHSSLNELQADHIDSSAVKSSNSRPRDRGRPGASKLPIGSSKSFNRHCYKWNEDSNNSAGCNYTHACIVYYTQCCVSSFSTFSWGKKKPSSNWTYSSPTTGFLTGTLLKNLFVSTLMVVFKSKIQASLDPLRTWTAPLITLSTITYLVALIHPKLPMMPWLWCVLVLSLLPLALNGPIDGVLFTVRIAHLKAFAGPAVDPTDSLQTISFVLVLEMHSRARPQPQWISYGKCSGYRNLPITLTILLTLHDVMDFSLPIHRALWEAFLLFLFLFWLFVFAFVFFFFFRSSPRSSIIHAPPFTLLLPIYAVGSRRVCRMV